MSEQQSVHNCRFGLPTMLLPWPFWYAAADDEWTCACNGVPRILHDASVCAMCRRWQPFEGEAAVAVSPPADRRSPAVV